jgi:hypothetical protein
VKRVGVKWVRALIRVRGTHSRTPTLLLPACSQPLAQLAYLLSFLPSFLQAPDFASPLASLTRSLARVRQIITEGKWKCGGAALPCPGCEVFGPRSLLFARVGAGVPFLPSFRNPPPWLSCPQSKWKPFSFLPRPPPPLLLLLHHFPQYLSQILLYPPSSGPHVSTTPTASFK